VITKTLAAEATYSDPMMIGTGQGVAYQVTAANLIAAVSLQWALWDGDSAQPASDSSRWITFKEVAVDADGAAGTIDLPRCWVRIGIETGNYTSGTAVATIVPITR